MLQGGDILGGRKRSADVGDGKVKYNICKKGPADARIQNYRRFTITVTATDAGTHASEEENETP
jgi:hypothetical protein